MRSPLLCILLVAAPLGLVSAAPAQLVGGTWRLDLDLTGAAPLEGFGQDVALVRDLDGDGLRELAIGSPAATRNGWFAAGVVSIHRSSDGARLLEITGSRPEENFGLQLDTLPDVDFDGVDELVVGAPQISGGPGATGRVSVYSGASGALLHQVVGNLDGGLFGISLATVRDTDGDGLADYVVGAPEDGSSPLARTGRAYLHSGATGALILRYEIPQAESGFGASVSGIADVDADGIPDLVIGAPDADPRGVIDAGSVYMFSGNGPILSRIDGASFGERLGQSVVGLDDVDGDGAGDFLVGLPRLPGGALRGELQLRSGATRALLWRRYGGGGFGYGQTAALAGDVDGDGTPDALVATHPAASQSTVELVSTADGALLRSFPAGAGEAFGAGLGSELDLEGDGLHELALGAPARSVGGQAGVGGLELHRFLPHLRLDRHELSLGGAQPARADLEFPPALAGQGYTLLASVSGKGPTTLGGVAVPLTDDPVFRALLHGPPPPFLRDGRGTLDAAGRATAWIDPAPLLGGALGLTFQLAAVAADPSGQPVHTSSVARPLTIAL